MNINKMIKIMEFKKCRSRTKTHNVENISMHKYHNSNQRDSLKREIVLKKSTQYT